MRPMPQEIHEALWHFEMLDTPERTLLVQTFCEPARWALAIAWHRETFGWPESVTGASGGLYDGESEMGEEW